MSLSFLEEELIEGIPALLSSISVAQPTSAFHKNPSRPTYEELAVQLSECVADVDEFAAKIQSWQCQFDGDGDGHKLDCTYTFEGDWGTFAGKMADTAEALWGRLTFREWMAPSYGGNLRQGSPLANPLLSKALEVIFDGDSRYCFNDALTLGQWKATVGSVLVLLLDRWCEVVMNLTEAVAAVEIKNENQYMALTSSQKIGALLTVSVGVLETLDQFTRRDVFSFRGLNENSKTREFEGGINFEQDAIWRLCEAGATSSSSQFETTCGPLIVSMKTLFSECCNVVSSCFVDMSNFWLLSVSSPMSERQHRRQQGGCHPPQQSFHNTFTNVVDGAGMSSLELSFSAVKATEGGSIVPFAVSKSCHPPIDVSVTDHTRGELDVPMLLTALGALLSVTHSKIADHRVCTFEKTLGAFGVWERALSRIQTENVSSHLSVSEPPALPSKPLSNLAEQCLMALARLEQGVALLQSAISGYISAKGSIFVTSFVMPGVWGGAWEAHHKFVAGRAITHSIPYFFSYLASEVLEGQIMGGCVNESACALSVRRVLSDIVSTLYKQSFLLHYSNHVLSTRSSETRTKQLCADTLAVIRYARWFRHLGVHCGHGRQHYMWSPTPATPMTVSRACVEYFSHCSVDADASIQDFFLLNLFPNEVHVPSILCGDGTEAEAWECQRELTLLAAISLRTADLSKVATWRESISEMQLAERTSSSLSPQGSHSMASVAEPCRGGIVSQQSEALQGNCDTSNKGHEVFNFDEFCAGFWMLPASSEHSDSACWDVDRLLLYRKSWYQGNNASGAIPRILTPMTMRFIAGTTAKIKRWQLLPADYTVAALGSSTTPDFASTKIGAFFPSASEASRILSYFGKACRYNANGLAHFDILLRDVERLTSKSSASASYASNVLKYQVPCPLLTKDAVVELSNLPLVNLLLVADVAGISTETFYRAGGSVEVGDSSMRPSLLTASFTTTSGGVPLSDSKWKLVDKIVTSQRYEFWDVFPPLSEEGLEAKTRYTKAVSTAAVVSPKQQPF